jgi:hypothetical protein
VNTKNNIKKEMGSSTIDQKKKKITVREIQKKRKKKKRVENES